MERKKHFVTAAETEAERAKLEEERAERTERNEAARQMVEEQRLLRASRAAVKAKDAVGWQAEAVRRWGDLVACETDDWEEFVASREASPAPTSPEMLLQEHYADEAARVDAKAIPLLAARVYVYARACLYVRACMRACVRARVIAHTRAWRVASLRRSRGNASSAARSV